MATPYANRNPNINKGIGDAGSTADIRMLWSAIVNNFFGLIWLQLSVTLKEKNLEIFTVMENVWSEDIRARLWRRSGNAKMSIFPPKSLQPVHCSGLLVAVATKALPTVKETDCFFCTFFLPRKVCIGKTLIQPNKSKLMVTQGHN